MENKRIFFGLEVKAPWPEQLPEGKILSESARHLTLVFLGNVNFESFLPHIHQIPLPQHKNGMVGYFDKTLFLPERDPHVVAWHLQGLDPMSPLLDYQKQLTQWLKGVGFPPAGVERPFLPHLTLCRKPFNISAWKNAFAPVPFITGPLHLYESVGNLQYTPLWSHPIPFPFVELEHTADIAYQIRGEHLEQLFVHAQVALAWKFPPLIKFCPVNREISNLDDIVIALNEMITQSDSEIGCPMKAVSFHGEIQTTPQNLLEWEMIIDV